VPAIVTPVGGIQEIVEDGVSACLVAPGDIASLQRQIQRLLADRALAARIGSAARESARLRFAPERALPALEELYRSLGVKGESAAANDAARELKRAA
jgi:glycosyltransferase involved in cell wall biosynthesis